MYYINTGYRTEFSTYGHLQFYRKRGADYRSRVNDMNQQSSSSPTTAVGIQISADTDWAALVIIRLPELAIVIKNVMEETYTFPYVIPLDSYPSLRQCDAWSYLLVWSPSWPFSCWGSFSPGKDSRVQNKADLVSGTSLIIKYAGQSL